jgi:molecular chaperone HscA
VKPQYGLTDEEVEKMLLASITHAKEDIQTRALVEAQTSAQQLLDVTVTFLEKNSEMITEEEQQRTREAMNALQDIIGTGNRDLIQERISHLNDVSRPFAERLADKALKAAMSGKKI